MALLQGLILLLGILSFGRCQETCVFHDICQETKTINKPCNIFPPCRTITVNRPCIREEMCTSHFDTWSPCDVTCDIGTRSRIGRCCSPSCSKIVTETEACDTGIPCVEEEVDGNWSPWSSWTDTTSCSASCCVGVKGRTRSRTCTNPPPSASGMTCPGPATESELIECNTQDCPVTCVGNEFQPSPCDFCIADYYKCNSGTPDKRVCESPNVWSVQFSACVSVAICIPPFGLNV